MLSSSYQKVICWTQEISTWRYVLPYGLNSIPLFPVQKKSEKSTPLIVKFHFILQLTSDGDDDAAASETFLRDLSPALPITDRRCESVNRTRKSIATELPIETSRDQPGVDTG